MHNSRKQQTKLQALPRKSLFARLLRDDAVVDGQVHVAVDFENALKLAHRLDDGRVDETKEVAKGTGARGGRVSRVQHSTKCLWMIVCTRWVG